MCEKGGVSGKFKEMVHWNNANDYDNISGAIKTITLVQHSNPL
jgi:hypothetical protein